jgi:hypothetical protein
MLGHFPCEAEAEGKEENWAHERKPENLILINEHSEHAFRKITNVFVVHGE